VYGFVIFRELLRDAETSVGFPVGLAIDTFSPVIDDSVAPAQQQQQLAVEWWWWWYHFIIVAPVGRSTSQLGG
jgi:hypothetical protein